MFTTPFTYMAGSTGGGGPINPDSIPNLIRWWKSDAGVSQSGGYVTTWTDQKSGVIATADSTTNFTLADPLNSINGIESPFNNTISMQWASITLTALTIFAVLKRTGIGSPQYILGSSSSQGIGAAYDDGSGFKPFIYDGPSGMILQGGSSPLNSAVYTTWGLSTSTGFIRQNGTQVASNAGNPNSQMIDRIFENSTARFRALQGTIWEILIYDRVLTNTEITDLETYLATKYAL